MSGTESEKVWKIVLEKLKYGQKVLSEEAMAVNYFTFIDLFDYLSFSFDFVLSDTLFSSLLSSVLLGIPFSEIIPVTLDFNISLPSPEEFSRGLLLKIERVSLIEKYPELLTLSSLLYSTLNAEAAHQVITTQLKKAVYGATKYSESYYDPEAVAKFFRSTLYALTKKRSTDETVKRRIEAAARALDIQPDLAAYIFNSMQITTYSKIYSSAFDYSWFDVTLFPKEGSEPRVVFIDWDLVEREAESMCVVDSAGSCWFDNCLMDLNLFAAEEAPTIYIPEKAGMLLTEISQYMYQRARSRLLASGIALANYQTSGERIRPEKSIRLETYGAPRFTAQQIRSLVENALRDKVESGFDLNLYVTAALSLLKHLTKPGGWGDEAFKAMSIDELREYFVSKWSSQGLDEECLNKIFSLIVELKISTRVSDLRERGREVLKASRS